MKFIKLTEINGTDVLVNFDNVQSVWSIPNESTIVIFGKDEFLQVKEKLSDIEALFKKGEKQE